jgi:5-methyltetrahydrofolate corrinoid/iron sulfur protein methyltransferase
MQLVICVGENINIMSKTIGPAIKERRTEPILEMAKHQERVGIEYLDLNIGPSPRDGEEVMGWLVRTVQGAVQKPLSLDTTNSAAMEVGLKNHKGKALINSVSLQPERLEKVLPMAKIYNAYVIGLLWGKEGMPRDANERAALAVDFIYQANTLGIATDDIWIDPIVTPVSVEINQVISCLEFMAMLKDIAPEAKSIVGLSNISNGTPTNLRPVLNRAYLMMLMKYGLYSAILDAYDMELLSIAKGGMLEIVRLVHRMMDGQEPDLKSLSPKEVEYAKTAKVLLGKTLYSHSWLQL